jgi:hypothetical protein
MNWFSGLLRRQGQLMLTNDIYALFNTVMLVILPFTGWMAASVIALITLKKGLKTGGLLLIAAFFANFFMLKTSLPLNAAVVGALLSYMPCYLAAGTLYITRSWRTVACMLFLMALSALCILQTMAPEFITQQYIVVCNLLAQLQLGDAFLALSKGASAAEQTIFANYLIGAQAAGVVLSSLISLAIARFIQAKLYYPGGFKLEMRALRGMKVDLVLLITILFAAKQHYLLAIDVLPIVLLFFFIAGLSLWFDCMATRRNLFAPMLIASVVLGFFPQIMLPVYVLFGSLDTLFNFRLYLLTNADKAIREVK